MVWHSIDPCGELRAVQGSGAAPLPFAWTHKEAARVPRYGRSALFWVPVIGGPQAFAVQDHASPAPRPKDHRGCGQLQFGRDRCSALAL